MNKQIIIIVIIIITSAACSLVVSEGIPSFSPLSPLKRSQMKSQLPTSIVKKYILDIFSLHGAKNELSLRRKGEYVHKLYLLQNI